MTSHERLHIIFGTAAFGTGSPLAKIQDVETAAPIIVTLQARNVTDVDTARAYPVGSPGAAERLLGELGVPTWANLSTKVNSWAPGTHTVEGIQQSVAQSLEALKTDKVDIMYLHAPDRHTPFEETCRAMDAEYRKGKFARFGISNYTADEVEEIVSICEKHGFVKPSVYQGRYNPIIRSGETQLFPVLRRHGISFYAYRYELPSLSMGVPNGSTNFMSCNIVQLQWAYSQEGSRRTRVNSLDRDGTTV